MWQKPSIAIFLLSVKIISYVITYEHRMSFHRIWQIKLKFIRICWIKLWGGSTETTNKPITHKAVVLRCSEEKFTKKWWKIIEKIVYLPCSKRFFFWNKLSSQAQSRPKTPKKKLEQSKETVSTHLFCVIIHNHNEWKSNDGKCSSFPLYDKPIDTTTTTTTKSTKVTVFSFTWSAGNAFIA